MRRSQGNYNYFNIDGISLIFIVWHRWTVGLEEERNIGRGVGIVVFFSFCVVI